MGVMDLMRHNGYVQAILGYAILLILIGWFVGRRVRRGKGRIAKFGGGVP